MTACKVGHALELALSEYYTPGTTSGKDGKLPKICVGGIAKSVDSSDEVSECVCCSAVEKNLDTLVDESEKSVNVAGTGVAKHVDSLKNCIMDHTPDRDNTSVPEGNIVLHT